MELVWFAKELLQGAAEQLASYRIGQSALRYMDRALWVVEKCARWAVPPPLDQDDKPQPELVRPLPWVFFLMMLIALRVTRESISLVNLVLGKPPLRSADVVMYIQSKRRYLRTLKYQGNRVIRSRASPHSEPWYSRLQALFEFTMCFRQSHQYGNNNSTQVSNNEEVLIVKHNNRSSEPTTAAGESTMERLIEKMMVELDADSDDDSSFTLTNATSLRSDPEVSDIDQETTGNHKNKKENKVTPNANNDRSVTPTPKENIPNNVNTSTPKKEEVEVVSPKNKQEVEVSKENGIEDHKENVPTKANLSEPTPHFEAMKSPKKGSPKEDSSKFIENERCAPKSPKQNKFANGRALSVPNKKKGAMNQRRVTETPIVRITQDDTL